MTFKILGDEGWTTNFKIEVCNLLLQNENVLYFETLDASLQSLKDLLKDKFVKLSVKAPESNRLIGIKVFPDLERSEAFLLQRPNFEVVESTIETIEQDIRSLLEKE